MQLVLVDDFITKENIKELIDPSADYVIDFIDNSRIKAALIAWCKQKKLKLLLWEEQAVKPTLV